MFVPFKKKTSAYFRLLYTPINAEILMDFFAVASLTFLTPPKSTFYS